jgi:hypothetical protein
MPNSPISLLGVIPPSKIFSLMQLGGMTFTIANNAGWYDTLTFPDPADPTQPLNITGIDFWAELRTSPEDISNKLDMKSFVSSPQFVVGGTNGTLYFSVDVTLIKKLAPTVYQMDILAIDHATGMVRNLCELGPIAVTVIQGVTR